MTWLTRFRVRLVALVVGSGLACGQDALPVEDIRLPLERWPNGKVRRQLHAEQARMPAEGPIEASGVRIECFDKDGKLELAVEADDCVLNREAGAADSDGAVRAEAGDMVITGKGFTWSAEDERVVIQSEARVEFYREITEWQDGNEK